ncbi:host cell division inhibitor Icd-like protein [Testudinibacter sp. TR-2022]|uniref:host cell division inhibitor Icd-like protein n=1 Tax=Testudinibacter sp. TR-2022 TaxID=2585029 RepID=UPI00111A6D4C|nr:host cell division inhibitor Icd-like protein [Testudinibacter sp. TR-2022]TNH03481.1 host cell division inhibitor Icd-like protein [Pasteurellaceae bacterium Phil31]TNH07946.1 host cell division inhibitor Icd-like protein [Testudinibacter sp. TR-2022]TNH10317.1 host cell division inhibitor Icd-like protein [Testudinibacter sp. TR-2022]
MAKPDYTRKTISTNIQKCDLNHFTTHRTLGYFVPAVAKSAAEPENSNRYTAHDTPDNACFFMRKSRTPKENNPHKTVQIKFLSMVACDGKGFALCCVPCIAVSQPVARYRPSLRTAAVTSKIKHGVTAMIYQFLGVSRHHYDKTQAQQIRIQADSENHARAALGRDFVLVLLGRLPDSAANDRTLTATSKAQGVIYA